jgi:hypothetical protein
MFFIWSGNHKFYIQYLRLLGLQSFIIINNPVQRNQRYASLPCNVDVEDNFCDFQSF